MTDKAMQIAENVWQYLTSCWTTLYLLPGTCFPSAEIHIHNRRFKVVRLLGEGGYSFIHLVKEIPTAEQPFVPDRFYAIKLMNLGSEDQIRLAEAEIDILNELRHPHIIRLLASTVVPNPGLESGGYRGLMLFPWYQEGSAADLICEAVQYLHEAGYCHRDIKPHNILIERRDRNGFLSEAEDPEALILSCIPEASEGEFDSVDWVEEAMYNAVLTDFGSVGPSQIIIENRQQSLQLQEELEVLSSMPYRAPELFDVPSPTVIDEKIDTWSLGCTLYFLMYGVSPFERVMAESGGSIALAVTNGRIQWPKPPIRHYPPEIHSLVAACLDTNPQTRPLTSELVIRVRNVLTESLQQRK